MSPRLGELVDAQVVAHIAVAVVECDGEGMEYLTSFTELAVLLAAAIRDRAREGLWRTPTLLRLCVACRLRRDRLPPAWISFLEHWTERCSIKEFVSACTEIFVLSVPGADAVVPPCADVDVASCYFQRWGGRGVLEFVRYVLEMHGASGAYGMHACLYFELLFCSAGSVVLRRVRDVSVGCSSRIRR